MATAKKNGVPVKFVVFTTTHNVGIGGGESAMPSKRRTIEAPTGARYTRKFHHGEPVLLVGQHEIDACERDLASGRMLEIRVAPEHRDQLLAGLTDKAAKEEIERLNRRVANLEDALAEARQGADPETDEE